MNYLTNSQNASLELIAKGNTKAYKMKRKKERKEFEPKKAKTEVEQVQHKYKDYIDENISLSAEIGKAIETCTFGQRTYSAFVFF